MPAAVLTLALKRSLDSVEWHLTGPRYVGLRVDPVPDTDMASLMLRVAERIRSTAPAPGTSQTRAIAVWRREVARLAHLLNQLRVPEKPAAEDLVDHFAGVYIAEAARELRTARFLLGDGAAGASTIAQLGPPLAPPPFLLAPQKE